MTNALTIFSNESASVVFTTKKGDVRAISPEGALFVGGLALASLKDVALESAVLKASQGRYQAAADILGAAFPKVLKACVVVLGSPSQNKIKFGEFLGAIERTQEPEKGWSKKQITALVVLRNLRRIPALAAEAVVVENTVEAVVVEAAAEAVVVEAAAEAVVVEAAAEAVVVEAAAEAVVVEDTVEMM